MNSRAEELEFLEVILSDLKNYEDHNDNILDDILSVVQYRKNCEIKHQKKIYNRLS